jgi:ABC-2 type transport system ATP-binding protein
MIVVENLTKEFKSFKKYPGFKGTVKGLFTREVVGKKAVDDISFRIGEGEIVGYIGSNGAGKSTTIKMMTGILVPTSGRCVVNGIIPYEKRMENAQQIGAVFGQRTQLWWDLPLTETFSILKEIYNVSDKDFKNRMDFLDQVLNLSEFINNTVRTLSLGQRMRADLGAALLHNPKVLYLDEPTIGLDVVVKENIRLAIKEINKEYKTTVVLTTHDLGDIEELCNRIIIIDAGKKVYDGGLKNIRDTHGYMRIIDIDVKNADQIKDIDFNARFNLLTEDLKVNINGNSISVNFNRNRISASEIASLVMENATVRDMSIKDTDINQIVKKIYKNGVN